jgi:hypothetical protein
LVSALGGNAVNAIQNLSSSLAGISSYNATYQSLALQATLATVTTTITNYQIGVINDFSDSPSFAILTQVSNASAYSGCTTPAFYTDSWVPSDSQTYLSCLINGGSNATSSVCGGGNFASASGGCSGCMDTTSILNTGSYANTNAVLTALNGRYTAGGCSTFNNDLSNVWTNYYSIKSNAYSPVASRTSSASTSVNTFVASITGTLNTTFSNAVTGLAAVASSVTDSKYGLVAGMNCQLIGQDFTTITTTFCQSLFTVLFFSRIVVGCASFGILVAICCGACTGVRFYKHSLKKIKSIDGTGFPKEEAQYITNTNLLKPQI